MRKFGIIFCICVCMLFSSGLSVEAASNAVPRTESERQQRIVKLLREVLRLQELLAETIADERAGREPYQSVLFTLPIETIYFVSEGKLVPAQGEVLRAVDQEIFTLFREVIGEAAVEKYVAEWRIFNVQNSSIDAAVESIGDTGKFLVSVNRAGYLDRMLVRRSFANLFIHEYAHLLFFERPEFVADYTALFWSRVDAAHARTVAAAVSSRQNEILESYFESNQDRFVSEYATLSPDEDMAEAFVAFVVNAEKPAATSLKNQKIRYFYTEPIFGVIRSNLRDNLTHLGLY